MSTEAVGFDCVFEKAGDINRWFGLLTEHIGSGWHGHVTELYTLIDGFPRFLYEEPDELPIDCGYLRKLADPKFCVIHLVMHLYPGEHALERIDSYADYLRSDCEMIVLAVDGYFLELYCKDPRLLRELAEQAKTIPGVKLEEKTEENDGRTRMYV